MDHYKKLETYLNNNNLKMTAPRKSSLSVWMTFPVTLRLMIYSLQ